MGSYRKMPPQPPGLHCGVQVSRSWAAQWSLSPHTALPPSSQRAFTEHVLCAWLCAWLCARGGSRRSRQCGGRTMRTGCTEESGDRRGLGSPLWLREDSCLYRWRSWSPLKNGQKFSSMRMKQGREFQAKATVSVKAWGCSGAWQILEPRVVGWGYSLGKGKRRGQVSEAGEVHRGLGSRPRAEPLSSSSSCGW